MKFLKNLIRRWLEIDPVEPARVDRLAIYEDDRIVDVKVVGIVGLRLRCAKQNGDQILVSQHAAVSAAEFDKAMSCHLECEPTMQWEDGTPVTLKDLTTEEF